MPQVTPQKISKTFPEYSVTRCKSGWLVKSSCGEVIKHAKTLSAAWEWIGCREIEKAAWPSPEIVSDPSEYEKERQSSTSAQARYRANHPDRVAATAKKVEGKTIKRASVRFMVNRDEDIFQWLEDNYGGSGGPEILKALREACGKSN